MIFFLSILITKENKNKNKIDGRHDKERKWLYVEKELAEKIFNALMKILEKKYDVKIEKIST